MSRRVIRYNPPKSSRIYKLCQQRPRKPWSGLIFNGGKAPDDPEPGSAYRDTHTGDMFLFDGVEWKHMGFADLKATPDPVTYTAGPNTMSTTMQLSEYMRRLKNQAALYNPMPGRKNGKNSYHANQVVWDARLPENEIFVYDPDQEI